MRASFIVLILACSFHQYFAATKVDGGWSEWEPFGPCDKSCGGGYKRQYRYCNNPWPANGGKECDGSNVNAVECNTHACPVNGGWGSWSAFGSCSQTCGAGYKMRYRQCTDPEPANGGEPCFGLSSERKTCNAHACPDEPNSDILVASDGSKYQLVGCFKDYTRRMHQLLITERDHTSHAWNGMWIDWNNWDSYMAGFIDRCAVKTKIMNYAVFGMSHYGECYSDAGVLDALALFTDNLKSSSKCVTNGYVDCTPGDTRCIGKDHGIAVFQIIEK